MGSTIDFSTVVRGGYLLAAAVGLLALLAIFEVSWMRARLRRREEGLERFRQQWGPLLHAPLAHFGAFPRVDRRHMLEFTMLWNFEQEQTYRAPGDQSAVRACLNDIARKRGLPARALRGLRKRDLAERLSAICALGHLREREALSALAPLCESPDAATSFSAARAMVQIDGAYADRFVRMMALRTDWSAKKLMTVVREERDAFAAPLARRFGVPDPLTIDAFVPYLRFIDRAIALPIVRNLLTKHAGEAVTMTEALKVLAAIGDFQDAPLAAHFVEHEDWRVRVQAANALGQLGGAPQANALRVLLNDEHWWVRYRAAVALGMLATMGQADLDEILRNQHDRFARDVLMQVIAENSPVVQGAAS